jgi:hypothetical protein
MGGSLRDRLLAAAEGAGAGTGGAVGADATASVNSGALRGHARVVSEGVVLGLDSHER